MLIGYARLSNAKECIDVQKTALDEAGIDELYVDVASGVNAKLPQLNIALSRLDEGHTLVVWRLDRLGQSLRHVNSVIGDLAGRGIGFRSLVENIDTTVATSKPLSHFCATFYAALALADRVLIRERTAAGRAAAKARRRQGGRKPKLDEKARAQALTLYNESGLSVDDICDSLQIGRSTLFRYRREVKKTKTGTKPKRNTADALSVGE